MNTLDYAGLDAEELFHLAVKASGAKEHEKAISYLKESLAKNPTANAQYILAAEHAEIGMYERAIEEMSKAIEMNPELWTAHFQKGLLYITLGKVAEAVTSWQSLSNLPNTHYLYHFSKGFTYAIQNNTQQAIDAITAGIDCNQENPALNTDMTLALNNLKKVSSNGADTNAKNSGDYLYLSAYNQDNK